MGRKLTKSHKNTISAFQKAAPVDVVSLANALGVEVWESNQLKSASGKIFKDSKYGGASGYAILVNVDDPFNRKRFTIAHEIAHFLLHVGELQGGSITDDALYRSGLSSSEEGEANRLAAEILMPLHLLQDSATTPSNELAERLMVSELAMKIQLRHWAESAISSPAAR